LQFHLQIHPDVWLYLFTDHPPHIAAGSMPPQNGFCLGGAFVWTKNTRNWRLSWDFDAVGATTGGAWRAGGYMKLIHMPHPKQPQIEVVTPMSGESAKANDKSKDSAPFTHPYTLFNLYAQSISLNKLNYFGEGNATTLAGASLFGLTQTIVGANAIKPVDEWATIRKLSLALLGEINGRFSRQDGAIGSVDRNSVYKRDRAGPEQPAGIRATRPGNSYQARYRGLFETELPGEVRGILCALEFDELVFALDSRPESHNHGEIASVGRGTLPPSFDGCRFQFCYSLLHPN
jgi:hypothetical protein